MDERRDTSPAGDTPPQPLASAGSRLTPVQQAYSAYTQHAIRCDDCRCADLRCETAERLWKAYRTIADVTSGRVARPAG